jgi:cytochrome c-type biogenesis protein CcmH
MMQYLLTVLAGIALGIVGMRVWQMREAGSAASGDEAKVADADGSAAPSAPGMPQAKMLMLGAGALVLIAGAVFAFRPAADSGAATASGAMGAATGTDGKAVGDVDSMMDSLAKRLDKKPDGEGFRMLGWSYLMTGHPEKAIEPYKRAIAMIPGNAGAHAGYGEALTSVAKGTVTQQAKNEFDRATAIDKSEPRARYFQAVWLSQHGQDKQALDQWIALANDGPADAPWSADLHKQITDSSKKLGVDVSSRLKAAPAPLAASTQAPAIDSSVVQAAASMAPTDRQAMVDQMVEGLAAKLQANPKDTDGWIRLIRSRMVLSQTAKAKDDLAMARNALAGSSADLAKLNAAASELKVP